MYLRLTVFSFVWQILTERLLAECALSLVSNRHRLAPLAALSDLEVVFAAVDSVKIHVGYSEVHLIQLVLLLPELRLQFFFDKFAFLGPGAQAFGDDVVGEACKFAILCFHLIVLRVENDWLLYLLNTSRLELIVTDAQFANREVVFESFFDFVAALLGDAAVEDLQFVDGAVVGQEVGDGSSALVFEFAIAQEEVAQEFVLLEGLAQEMDLRAVDLAVRDVDQFDLCVWFEYLLQYVEIPRAQIVFWDVEVLQPISLTQRQTKMLQP